MKNQMFKRLKNSLVVLGLSLAALYSVHAAENDGWTEAEKGVAWDEWVIEWERVKNDWTQIALTPGENETELNFAWYAPIDLAGKPMVKISLSPDMKDAIEYGGEASSAVEGYLSNKVVITNLSPQMTYYYVYGQGEEWSDPIQIQTQSTDKFSFIVTGDPQIGSSRNNIPVGESEVLGQDNATRNDAFNWNQTLNQAMSLSENASFLINVGDQIQTRDKAQDQLLYTENEIEYAGYLSPVLLKSLPVATLIGNHDSSSGNYSFHFNNPNATNLGQTMAGGGYYYSYGDVLFISINSNSEDYDAHEELIRLAVESHPDATWRFVSLHHDIYGSGEHSNEPSITSKRYEFAPMFEKYGIDVVLAGHDHTYSRSKFLKGATKEESVFLTDDEFELYFDGKLESDKYYESYLERVEDAESIVENDKISAGVITNPEGIIYYTLGSASGSKYYEQVEQEQAYIANRWQANVPSFMIVDVEEDSITIETYRTDTLELIDDAVTIRKVAQLSDEGINDDARVAEFYQMQTIDTALTSYTWVTGTSVCLIIIISGIVLYVRKVKH